MVSENKIDDKTYSDEEIARRRDAVLKRMLNTPPKPHKPKRGQDNKDKPKKRPTKNY